jgi:hypothetical protein
MFANSTENSTSVETKKESKVAKFTGIITKPAKFVKGLLNPFLNRKVILLAILIAAFYGVVYARSTQPLAKDALDFIKYDEAKGFFDNLKVQILKTVNSFGPTFAALFIFLSTMTLSFNQWSFPATNNFFFLLLWVLFLSSPGYFREFDVSLYNSIGKQFSVSTVSALHPGFSVASFCFMLLFSVMKFQNSTEEYTRSKREHVAPPIQTIESTKDEPKTLNSGTTETPQKEEKKQDIPPTEQKANPTETVPAKKFDAKKSPPKRPDPESHGVNYVAWVPIIIASVFGVGIVVGICYYKCCKRKSELGSDIDPNDVAAMQNYNTRRNTRNEFGQKF